MYNNDINKYELQFFLLVKQYVRDIEYTCINR